MPTTDVIVNEIKSRGFTNRDVFISSFSNRVSEKGKVILDQIFIGVDIPTGKGPWLPKHYIALNRLGIPYYLGPNVSRIYDDSEALLAEISGNLFEYASLLAETK